MEYTLYRFIKEDLGKSVTRFAKEQGLPQSKFSMWKSRNVTVGDLPIFLLIAFAAETNMSYDEIVTKLLRYEIEAGLESVGLDKDLKRLEK